jgi:hypothetical protein
MGENQKFVTTFVRKATAELHFSEKKMIFVVGGFPANANRCEL